MVAPTNTTVEKPADFGDGEYGKAALWITEIQESTKSQNEWLSRCEKIVFKYKDERNTQLSTKRQYAILWSNIETLKPIVYSRPPEAVVERRFKDDDPVGRQASMVLERALQFSIATDDFDHTLRLVRDDYLLFARGQSWVRYEPKIKTHTPEKSVFPQAQVDEFGVSLTDTAEPGYVDGDGNFIDPEDVRQNDDGMHVIDGEPEEVLEWEDVVQDYVNWPDFGYNPARTWQEVRYVWRRVFMTRDKLIERFGEEIGNKVPLDHVPETAATEKSSDQNKSVFKKATIYEIWDKSSKKALWLSLKYKDSLLDERDDPLGLPGFFPCPRPAFGTLTNDTLIPLPDYVLYQDQAEELDDLTGRIGKLTDTLRMVGLYAGEENLTLSRMFSSGNDNTLIPVDTWAAFAEKGGIRGVIEWMPVDMVIQTLKGCFETRQKIIDDIYQITGLSDIMRGSSDPNETATAQGIKVQWGAIRVRDRQEEVARFARDIVRIKGHIIAKHFHVETLRAMTNIKMPTRAELQEQMQKAQLMAQATGQPAPPPPKDQQVTWDDVMELFQSDAMRSYRMDIETDSTIQPNEDQEKSRRVEFITATSQFMQQVVPAVQQIPQLAPMLGQMLMFAVRGFRVGQELEDVIEKTMNQLQHLPPQQPDGAQQQDPLAEQKLALDSQQLQLEQQHISAQAADARNEAQRTQVDHTLGMLDAQTDVQGLQLKAHELALKRADLVHGHQNGGMNNHANNGR